MGSFICNATQKELYAYKPDDSAALVPDLADGPPDVSEDGKTVTVKIKQGVKYSPPYQDHTVTSADVKYAIERGFFNTVGAGFTQSYYGDLDGAKVGAKPGTTIKGITTPDDQTVVFKFKRPVGGVMAAGALAYGATAPVPKAYAAKYDKANPSTYGEHQLATGPYMISNDASGKATGYQPGKEIHLVRNPSWDKSLDFKPAYLDEIDNLEGNDDTTVASRRVLEGQSMISGDFSAPPDILKTALQKQKSQVQLIPSGGSRYIALNTKIKPFDDINVRKAVIAGMDRNALLLTRGGKAVGRMATHFIPPGIAGYDEAGGDKGFGLDFISDGRVAAAGRLRQVLQGRGLRVRQVQGTEKILMVGDNTGVAAKTSQVAAQQLKNMGFDVTLRLVEHATMYTRYCNTPSAKVQICPNVGWLKDFADGQTILDPTFNGKNILEQGNSNWPQLDVPAINEAMDKAELLPKDQRAQAWADIDKMVTEQAPAVPWIFDNDVLLESANVNGVASTANALWEIPWTSLK